MKINEIFYSIQGEGQWTGLPNIFIRTTGCNLRCSYCDTKYAYYDGEEFSFEEIMKKIKKYPCKHICLTGGEPLVQDETIDLIKKLTSHEYKLCLETNGSIKINELLNNKSILISLDIKCPSSNMNEKMIYENINLLRKKDQLKFVIKNRTDYDFAKKIVDKYQPVCTVFFQPVYKTDPEKLIRWIKEDGLSVKLGFQLHKIIWGDKKGV